MGKQLTLLRATVDWTNVVTRRLRLGRARPLAMGKKDARVDAYIAKSAEFARSILEHLRKLIHQGCPDVQETVKWGMPHFELS